MRDLPSPPLPRAYNPPGIDSLRSCHRNDSPRISKFYGRGDGWDFANAFRLSLCVPLGPYGLARYGDYSGNGGGAGGLDRLAWVGRARFQVGLDRASRADLDRRICANGSSRFPAGNEEVEALNVPGVVVECKRAWTEMEAVIDDMRSWRIGVDAMAKRRRSGWGYKSNSCSWGGAVGEWGGCGEEGGRRRRRRISMGVVICGAVWYEV